MQHGSSGPSQRQRLALAAAAFPWTEGSWLKQPPLSGSQGLSVCILQPTLLGGRGMGRLGLNAIAFLCTFLFSVFHRALHTVHNISDVDLSRFLCRTCMLEVIFVEQGEVCPHQWLIGRPHGP